MREASQAQPFDSQKFAEAAKQYIPLLRQHIFKENNVLFRMAEQVMERGRRRRCDWQILDSRAGTRADRLAEELYHRRGTLGADARRGVTGMSDYTLLLDLMTAKQTKTLPTTMY